MLQLFKLLIFAVIVACSAPTVVHADCPKSAEADVCVFPISDSEYENVAMLDIVSYHTAFGSQEEKPIAAFMLCNAAGRLSCEDAVTELAERFDTPSCRKKFFVAVVDGRGSLGSIMGQHFKIVFAIKGEMSVIYPVLVSMPDDDTSFVPCQSIADTLNR